MCQSAGHACEDGGSGSAGYRRLWTSSIVADCAGRRDQWHVFRGGAADSTLLASASNDGVVGYGRHLIAIVQSNYGGISVLYSPWISAPKIEISLLLRLMAQFDYGPKTRLCLQHCFPTRHPCLRLASLANKTLRYRSQHGLEGLNHSARHQKKSGRRVYIDD
jgi:hypothetical protein